MKNSNNMVFFKVLIISFFTLSANEITAQVFQNASGIYGLRKLNTTYTGSLIQVRRSSDNTTLNIGFTSCGDLDTTALKTFVGGSSAFISIWYDQSGNGRNASQASLTAQPQIINAGQIHRNPANKPCLFFDGGDRLTHTFVLTTQPASTSFIFNATATANPGTELFGWGANSGGGTRYGCWLDASSTVRLGAENAGAGFVGTTSLSANTWYLATQVLPSSNLTSLQQRLNGISQTMTNINSPANMNITFGEFSIGSVPGAGLAHAFLGFIGEISYYPSAINITRRALIESNQSNYFNHSITGIKYTPPAVDVYTCFVNGVGRESASDNVLVTAQSSGMGFSIGTAATDFLKDNGDYLTCAMNCPVTPDISTANLPPTVLQRWNNDWYINKTDIGSNHGDVTIYFDYSDYGINQFPGAAANYVLLTRTSPTGTFSVVSGTTASVSGDRISLKLDASNIITNQYYTIGTTNIIASPLPVELINFTGICTSNQTILNWSTATEINNDFFLIERSADGIAFESIAKVNGNGNSADLKYYNFTDNNPLNGMSYYRLKQTDFDGTSTYSGIITVNCDEGDAEQILVYPNPVDRQLTIVLTGFMNMKSVEIINSCGQVVYRDKVQQQANIATETFTAGMYLIKIQTTKGIQLKKFVKQ
jgi:hypothetical protein